MTLTYTDSQLPYIIFPEYNLKVLIDTGSTKSFIKPEIAKNILENLLTLTPFKYLRLTAHLKNSLALLFPLPKYFVQKKNHLSTTYLIFIISLTVYLVLII